MYHPRLYLHKERYGAQLVLLTLIPACLLFLEQPVDGSAGTYSPLSPASQVYQNIFCVKAKSKDSKWLNVGEYQRTVLEIVLAVWIRPLGDPDGDDLVDIYIYIKGI